VKFNHNQFRAAICIGCLSGEGSNRPSQIDWVSLRPHLWNNRGELSNLKLHADFQTEQGRTLINKAAQWANNLCAIDIVRARKLFRLQLHDYGSAAPQSLQTPIFFRDPSVIPSSPLFTKWLCNRPVSVAQREAYAAPAKPPPHHSGASTQAPLSV
jgi:hypothetical protein